MRQVELESITKTRNNPQLSRSGEKMSCYLDGITPEMVGSILELRKVPGKWVINSVDENDIAFHQVKINSYVGGIDDTKA